MATTTPSAPAVAGSLRARDADVPGRRGVALLGALLLACLYAAFAHGAVQVPDETRYQRVIPVWPENEPGEQPWNTGWYFNNHNRNKTGVTIDLASGWGQDLLLRLAPTPTGMPSGPRRASTRRKVSFEVPVFKESCWRPSRECSGFCAGSVLRTS